jgi:hypothetical protein
MALWINYKDPVGCRRRPWSGKLIYHRGFTKIRTSWDYAYEYQYWVMACNPKGRRRNMLYRVRECNLDYLDNLCPICFKDELNK